MYLSRVEIDTNNRQKIKDLSQLGAYHNRVERSFPREFESGEKTRKLWRIDPLNGKKYLLMVSKEKPDLEEFETYGVKGSGESKSYDEFLSSIKEGGEYKFRVTLNPVIAKHEKNKERGRVMPHVTAVHQEKFLLERAEKNGFALKPGDFTVVAMDRPLLRKKGMKSVNILRVSYEGLLKVTDKEKFIMTLTEGFGKKKAYGFGLMTVIPIEK